MVAILGRGQKIKCKNGALSAEDIKQALYGDVVIAGSITGYFKMKQAKSDVLIEVQSKGNVKNCARLERTIKSSLEKFIGFKVQVKVFEFRKFPYAMVLDYERKFRCD